MSPSDAVRRERPAPGLAASGEFDGVFHAAPNRHATPGRLTAEQRPGRAAGSRARCGLSTCTVIPQAVAGLLAVAACYSSHSPEGDADTDAVCESRCESSWECGDDGCGSSCGQCGLGLGCGVAHLCVPVGCAGAILIPAGPFLMGTDGTLPGGEPVWWAAPMHTVDMSAYRIMPCEVTNREYAACVQAGSCTPPRDTGSRTRTEYFGNAAYDSYPVINLTWYQAHAYCNWIGGALPTEAQWEKAARGGCERQAPPSCGSEDAADYPWGSASATCELANILYGWDGPDAFPCFGDTTRVGERPSGASVYGILDMVGNVSEWTADWWGWSDDGYETEILLGRASSDPVGPPDGMGKVRRGGWFGGGMPFVWERAGGEVGTAYDFYGFRCALSGSSAGVSNWTDR